MEGHNIFAEAFVHGLGWGGFVLALFGLAKGGHEIGKRIPWEKIW